MQPKTNTPLTSWHIHRHTHRHSETKAALQRFKILSYCLTVSQTREKDEGVLLSLSFV